MVLTAKLTHVKEQGPKMIEINQEMLTKFERECEKLEAKIRNAGKVLKLKRDNEKNLNSEENKGYQSIAF